MSVILFGASGGAAIASALVAGVFLTFSDFVMQSLAATPPAAAVQTMQVINRKVFRTLFMVLFLGMVVVAPVAALFALATLPGTAAVWVVAGGALYLFGVFGVTAAFNVPMNKRLATFDHQGTAAAGYWPLYVARWGFWNTVRTAASVAAAVCYLIACSLAAQAIMAA